MAIFGWICLVVVSLVASFWTSIVCFIVGAFNRPTWGDRIFVAVIVLACCAAWFSVVYFAPFTVTSN